MTSILECSKIPLSFSNPFSSKRSSANAFDEASLASFNEAISWEVVDGETIEAEDFLCGDFSVLPEGLANL